MLQHRRAHRHLFSPHARALRPSPRSGGSWPATQSAANTQAVTTAVTTSRNRLGVRLTGRVNRLAGSSFPSSIRFAKAGNANGYRLLAPACSSPPSVAMRPRVAARSPMSDALAAMADARRRRPRNAHPVSSSSAGSGDCHKAGSRRDSALRTRRAQRRPPSRCARASQRVRRRAAHRCGGESGRVYTISQCLHCAVQPRPARFRHRADRARSMQIANRRSMRRYIRHSPPLCLLNFFRSVRFDV